MIRSIAIRCRALSLPAAVGTLVLAATAVTSAPAGAAVTPERDVFAHLNPIPTGELANLRGGFRVGALEFDIGLMVTSMIEDIKVRTILSLNDNGDIAGVTSEVATTSGTDTFQVSDLGNGFELRVSDGISEIVHRALSDGLATTLQTSGNGTTSVVTTDLNIGVKNYSQVFNRAAQMGPAIRSMARDLGISGLN